MPRLSRALQAPRTLGFVAAASLLAYFLFDYFLALPSRSSSELFLHATFFAGLLLYGLAVGCALAACLSRTSHLGVWLGALTLVAALFVPLSSWPLFR